MAKICLQFVIFGLLLIGHVSTPIYANAYSNMLGCLDDNPIVVENTCNEGTTLWQIDVGEIGAAHGVEGYSDQVSVNAGETINFHLSSRPSAQNITLDIYRLGYYGGLGARLIVSKTVSNVPVGAFPVPDLTAGQPAENVGFGVAECNWPSLTNSNWAVPSNAVSGIYLVKLTGADGQKSYISFAVRRDDLSSDILYQQPVTTYQAYNDYPGYVTGADENPLNGKSFYSSVLGPLIPLTTGSRHARKVSFNRPYRGYSSFGIYDTAGLGFFNFEYPLIRWLEKKGYYVTYATDVDTHTQPSMLASGKHQMLLSAGHDEYWSWEMRKNITDARDRPNSGASKPINIGFFGANISYWQVRFANSKATGTLPANAVNRTMIGFKDDYDMAGPNGDPYYQTPNHSLRYKTTYLWRKQADLKPSPSPSATPVPFYPGSNFFHPEDEMIGIMTIPPIGDDDHQGTSANGFRPIFASASNPFVLSASVPAWAISGVQGEQTMPNMIGYESDELYPNHLADYSNRALSIIGDSPFYALRSSTGCDCGAPLSCRCSSVNLGTAESTFYKLLLSNGSYGGGAKVFAASGQQWSWGLDDWGANTTNGSPSVRPGSYTDTASKITENIMNCLINQSTACN